MSRVVVKNGRIYAPDLLHETKRILSSWNVRAKKKFSQNFLIDSTVYDRMIEYAGIENSDSVLEVGPGLGLLTRKLAVSAYSVVAVEYDESLREYTRENILNENIRHEFRDVLDIEHTDIAKWFQNETYKIVANLPYAISGAFFRKFTASDMRPKSMTVMVQKEVGERIVAKTGDMSVLSVSVQTYGSATYCETVPKDVFLPQPKVDSAIVHVDFEKPGHVFGSEAEEKKFWQLVKIGFSAPRKKLTNNLSAGLRIDKDKAASMLDAAGIEIRSRPQDVQIKQWVRLANVDKIIDIYTK